MIKAATSSSCQSAASDEVSATTNACPACTTQSLYGNNFDSAAGLAGWTTGSFVGGSVADWRGVQTCTAHSGANVFRFGGTTCTGNYANNDYNYAQPNGAGGIAVAAGAGTNRLSFWHRRDFESGYDGGTLSVSLDGSSYVAVPASAILSGPYNGTIAAECAPGTSAGRSAFTGTAASFMQTLVDLDAACNAASGGTEGCGGQAVRIAFTAVTDCGVTGDGWFLDDVDVSSCVPDAPIPLLSDGFENGTLLQWSGDSP